MLRYFLSDVLIWYHFADIFIAALINVKKRLWLAATQSLIFFILELLFDEVVRFHNPVIILLHDVMPLGVTW